MKAKVPRRLLTPKMRAWQEAYKGETRKVKLISKASEMGGFDFRDILRQSLFRMKDMLTKQPRAKLKELAQQPEEEGVEEGAEE